MKAKASFRLLRAILLAAGGITAFELHSATLTVSTNSDSGAGSLRQAILDANSSPGDDRIEITATGTIALLSPLPQIAENTELIGLGTNLLTISGNNGVRIFSIKSGTTNVFNGISIEFGLATNGANGAAIENAAELTLMSCVVANNNTLAGLGGGIYNSGNLTLRDSIIASNSVTGRDGFGGNDRGGQGGGGGGLGGGLFSASGAVLVSNVTFVANRAAGGNGGGGGGSDGSGAGGGGPNGGVGGAEGMSEINNGHGGAGGPGGFGGGGGGGGIGGEVPGFPGLHTIGGPGGDGGFGGGGGGEGFIAGDGVTWGRGGFGGGAGSPASRGLGTRGFGGGGGGLGGAIFLQSGDAALLRCSILTNRAIGGNGSPLSFEAGVGASGGSGFGGGVFGGRGNLELRECFVRGNEASGGAGGGGNYAGPGGQGGGGGVFILDATATLTGSTFASNRVVGGFSPTGNKNGGNGSDGGDGLGGGVCVIAGPLGITNCTFSSNEVAGGQGGTAGVQIHPQYGGAAFGGGLVTDTATVAVVNCTFSGNRVTGGIGSPDFSGGTLGWLWGEAHGGGFAKQSGTLSLLNVLTAGNTATTNSSPSDGFGAVMSQGHNLVGSTNEISGLAASDLQNVIANLGPLQDNGGLAPTHALQLNSPAIDAGASAGAPSYDQRGVARPQGEGIDIGAFELDRVSVLVNGHFVVSGPVTGLASVEVTLQTTFTNGTIVYTLDGSAPSAESALYAGRFTLTNSATIRAMAYSADFSQSHESASIQIVIVPIYSLTLVTMGQGGVTANPDGGTYPSNTVVNLTAIPAMGWIFSEWSGDVSADNPIVSIRMDRDKTIRAKFTEAPVYTLTVTVEGNGAVSLDPPGGSYSSNTRVHLTATADSGWVFGGWSGDVSGNDLTVDVTMTANRQVTARFIPLFGLSVNTPGGGTIEANPAPGPYPSNSVVMVTAVPASGWAFLYWLGDASGTNSSATINLTRNKSVRATFATALTVTVAGNGSVNQSPALSRDPYGAVVRLTAVPASASYFALWGNGASGPSNPLDFPITDANPNVSALFATLPPGQFSMAVIAEGDGDVAISPRANKYNSNDTVTLTAVAQTGQEFLGWSGDASGLQNPLVLTMDSSKVIRAQFTRGPVLATTDGFGHPQSETFRLLLKGEVGGHYSIESSTDLIKWDSWRMVTNDMGVVQLDDRPETNETRRFYRALLLVP